MEIEKEYEEEDYLMLSGLQHFIFCRRQWALIHIEQQWKENLLTVEGKLLHEKAHDSLLMEKRGDILISRGMPVSSRIMGISGVCDIVEFQRAKEGISLFGYEGNYTVLPIEYKHGKPKEDEADILQVTAQALCLEEMLSCHIEKGAIFYGGTKRRQYFELTMERKEAVRKSVHEMRQYYERRYTPKVKAAPRCKACSLKDICMPVLEKKNVQKYVSSYVKEEV